MAYFDTGYINTTFYGVSYGIRVDGDAARSDGTTATHIWGTCYDKQNTVYWASDPHNVRIDGLLGDGGIKPSGTGTIGQVWTRGFDTWINVGIGQTSAGFTAYFRRVPGETAAIGFTAWFGDGYSAPTGLAVYSPTVTHNTITAIVSLSSWGYNSGGNIYKELTLSKVNNDISNRRFQPIGGKNMSSSITTTNSSNQSGSMTISPNTRYYLAGYASNGNRNTGVQFKTNAVTLASGNSTINSIKPTKLVIDVTATSGVYTPTIKFRYKKAGASIWVDSVESYTGTSTSMIITGLKPATNYEMQQVVTTTAGTYYGSSFTFKTKPASIIIFPDGTKKHVSFKIIFPNGVKKNIDRWKKITY